MKHLPLLACFIVGCIFPVNGQINAELLKFSDHIGSGYQGVDIEGFIALHGTDYSRVPLENPYLEADMNDQVWKLSYRGGDFYFYLIRQTGAIYLTYWVLTPEYHLADSYKSLWGATLEAVRHRFGMEDFWYNESIASYGLPYGTIYIHYSEYQAVDKISWAADFP